MQVSLQEVEDLKEYILRLNDSAHNGAAVVAVEGMRDAAALRGLGYDGAMAEFHRFGGIGIFADRMARYNTVIVLFDWDRKGRDMTVRTAKMLQRRANVDLSFRRSLRRITRGRITFIEQLSCYESADVLR